MNDTVLKFLLGVPMSTSPLPHSPTHFLLAFKASQSYAGGNLYWGQDEDSASKWKCHI